MKQYQDTHYSQSADYNTIFELVHYYRTKYFNLLKEGKSEVELCFYQTAIQHYLSVLSMIKIKETRSNASIVSVHKSFFKRLIEIIKHKPKSVGWQTV